MFLLVSVRHVGALPGEHQHGVSTQISINLGKTFLRISRIRNIPLTWILARVFVYIRPFISQILLNGFDFFFIYFEWRDTENQQFFESCIHANKLFSKGFSLCARKIDSHAIFFRTRTVLLISILGSFLFGRIELVLTNWEIIFCPLELTFLLRSISKKPLNTLLRLYGLFVNCNLSQRLIYTKPSVT